MPDNNTNETPVKPQSDGSKFCGYMEYICSKLDEIAEGSEGGGGAGDGPGQHIYGVRWTYEDDGEGGKLLPSRGVRTDEAAAFNNPVPFATGSSQQAYIMNALSCGSPFDELYPWSGMVPVKDKLLVNMVAIPKFWYKWTKTEDYLQLQVATYAADGFHLSPAHRARNAQDSDRDVVYIGRYHGASMMMSATGSAPIADMTRANMRTMIATQMAQLQQTGYSLQDYAMFWTWRMLYLVEYGNWNGQETIGKGCGTGDETIITCPTCDGTGYVAVHETCKACDGTGEVEGSPCKACGGTGQIETGSTEPCEACGGDGQIGPSGQTEPFNNGTTDNMPYHTGTMQASASAWGQGVQYRYIEDPWAGVAEWIDGWYMAADTETGEGFRSVIMDPAQFSDTEGGVEIYRGTDAPNGWITDWAIPVAEGYDWALIPIAGPGGNQSTSVADYCGFRGPALCSGGGWIADDRCGPFFLRADSAGNRVAGIGARLQKLP